MIWEEFHRIRRSVLYTRTLAMCVQVCLYCKIYVTKGSKPKFCGNFIFGYFIITSNWKFSFLLSLASLIFKHRINCISCASVEWCWRRKLRELLEKGNRHKLWIVCKGSEKVSIWVRVGIKYKDPWSLEGYKNGRHKMVFRVLEKASDPFAAQTWGKKHQQSFRFWQD
jgi:hypothetical protein